MTKKLHCHRCGRRLRSGAGWNVFFDDGVPQYLVCPACQTPEEHVGAEVCAATMRYGRDSDGRFVSWPKGGAET